MREINYGTQFRFYIYMVYCSEVNSHFTEPLIIFPHILLNVRHNGKGIKKLYSLVLSFCVRRVFFDE
jgi:hypothetical protein